MTFHSEAGARAEDSRLAAAWPGQRIAPEAEAEASSDSGVVVRHVSHVVATGGGSRWRADDRDRYLQVIDDVSFRTAPGETLGLVGPSGCGKTTLLNMMAGLVEPTAGEVEANGRRVHIGERADRSIGYMTARGGLMPWRTVRRNVELGLEIRGERGKETRATAERFLEMVGLQGFARWYPLKLSQGMRQRVALARTLTTDPTLLLMDEPFAALDVQTKLTLQEQFTELWEGTGKTAVWVTHDVNEAVALCDRVLVMSPRPGRIRAEIPIPLSRPRDLRRLRFESEYQRLCERVWKEFEDESTDGD